MEKKLDLISLSDIWKLYCVSIFGSITTEINKCPEFSDEQKTILGEKISEWIDAGMYFATVHQVAFPMAELPPTINGCRTIVDGNPMEDQRLARILA